ncbi:MAG: hypothetical protein ACE5K8_09935, partial [Candidatus Zixiibacteriota bacterium]
ALNLLVAINKLVLLRLLVSEEYILEIDERRTSPFLGSYKKSLTVLTCVIHKLLFLKPWGSISYVVTVFSA